MGTLVEGGALSVRGNAPPPNLGTKYPFLTLSASSDLFLFPPIGPKQQEARGHGSCVGEVLRGQPPRVQGGAEKDTESICRTDGRVFSAKPLVQDLGRLFGAVHQRSYSRCLRISEVLTCSLS